MAVPDFVRKRAVRIPVVLLVVVGVTGIAISQRWVHADRTEFVPYVLLLYLALELLLSITGKARRKAE